MSSPSPNPGPIPRWPQAYRSRHRAKQDDLAHTQDAQPLPVVLPDDPLIPRGEPELITSEAGLKELIAHLRSAGSFAYDSEFIGEQSYVPRICVLQVATAGRVALVDPLSGLDLGPFWELLVDPGVEKIVHAGLQDLEPAWRDSSKGPANLFDTQVAAGFAGRSYPLALGKLVAEFVGVELGKSPKFSQWDRRPLTLVQLAYAANDVRFLPSLRARLGRQLEMVGNAAWAAEECQALGDPALYRFDVLQQSQRLKGTERLSRRELALVRALMVWRDEVARQMDMPPRAFLKDGVLLDLARNPIVDAAELSRVWGLPRPVETNFGQKIVTLTRQILDLPPASLPQVVRFELTDQEQVQVDRLWACMLEQARKRQVDGPLVGSRSELGRLFYKLVRGKDTGDARMLRGWRRELMGNVVADAAGAIHQARLTRHPGSQTSEPQNAAPSTTGELDEETNQSSRTDQV